MSVQLGRVVWGWVFPLHMDNTFADWVRSMMAVALQHEDDVDWETNFMADALSQFRDPIVARMMRGYRTQWQWVKQFIKIQAAYELLIDGEKRRQYDNEHRVNPMKRLPNDFAKTYLKEGVQHLTIETSDGRTWPAVSPSKRYLK
ncbi:hypothetical protein IFM89_032404 [Coptis chinensis]|uniref:Uncharacterized protein n=1 Tax=Coptis chinensis TaxID=261450 RepID=A0A835HZX2_9MAGN|nr:hypothetical protein IFM89_032404 [Coptis chinensis]